MVAFLTFLLGLTVGVQRIELAVDHRVASVELLLDGQRVALIAGRAVGRRVRLRRARCCRTTSRRSRATPRATSSTARCSASTCRAKRPRRPCGWIGGEDGYTGGRAVLADGRRQRPRGDPGRLRRRAARDRRTGGSSLPRYDRAVGPRSRGRADLPQARCGRAVEVAFGGEYGEKVSTELTAVPLELDGGEVAAVRRGGRARGYGSAIGPARVVAVERGPREVVLVRDDASMVTLRGLGRQGLRQRRAP